MKKIAIFVDVQNIYYTTREAFGRPFNYRQLWQMVKNGPEPSEIIIANAYAIQRNDDQQIKFQDALKHIGFNVKLKPFIQRRDGSAKGDWDVGITIDLLEAAQKVDHVILLSGDGDFDLLLKTIHERYHLTSEVYGVEKLTAQSLIRAATHFHPIDQSLLL